MTPPSIFSDLSISEDLQLRDEALASLVQRIRSAPVDTRSALSALELRADQFQHRVIEAQERTIRLVAPAGSGKTQTMINRVVAQVRQGVKPSRILLLTFDNSAASSLRSKLKEQEEEIAKQIGHSGDIGATQISTLNAFGYGLLRQDIKEEYRSIVKSTQRRWFFREAKEGLRSIHPDRHGMLPPNVQESYYLELVSLLKNNIFDPRHPKASLIANFLINDRSAEVLFPEPEDIERVSRTIEAVIWLHQAYDRVLQANQVIDFDDQKLRPYVYLAEAPELLSVVQGRFSEVIVDEFQDINLLDFELVKSIAERATLVVTGDDDQAIYGFRGCSPEYIIDLEKHLGRPVTSYQLRVNYRSPANIVQHADHLIRHNTWRVVKDPIANQPATATITLLPSLSAGLEAKAIVEFVRSVRRQNARLGFQDLAVLYRTNAQSLPIQVEFILNQIPYFVRDEDNILNDEALDRLIAVLRCKMTLTMHQRPTTDDQVAMVRSYFRYMNRDEQDAIHRFFARSAAGFAALDSAEFGEVLPKAQNSNIQTAIAELGRAKGLREELDVLRRKFRGFQAMVGSLEDAVDQKVPLAEISEVAASFRDDTAVFVETLESALTRAKESGAGRDESGVALSTYFKAKGLQWHSVILATCNDGLIPHRKAPVEDERRLFYVAMTRATSNLLVSYVENAVNTKVIPSRFLREAKLLP